MRKTTVSLLVLTIFCLSSIVSATQVVLPANRSSQALTQLASSSPPASSSDTYGLGLSGGPVVMDANYLASLEGNPPTIQNMELNVSKYFIPLGIHLVFLDPFWGNQAANTTTTEVLGGYNQKIADWLAVGHLYNISTIFFFKQFGYLFSSPSWDSDFLNAYPGAATVNSNGVNVPLTSCSGCTSSSGWSIASPFVYRQMEEDLMQLYKWYGGYTSWIGFGEGATGDRNYYGNVNPGASYIKTSRPWDNFTMSVFANSVFFQRNVNASGYYVGTNTPSKIWNMFLNDRPDIALSTGTPLVYPLSYSIYGGKGPGGNLVLQRFYVPFGTNLNGFVLKSYLSKTGTPSSPLYITIYPDEASNPTGPYNVPVLSSPVQNVSVSNPITTTGGWVSTDFTATLIGGNYYWAAFTSSSSSSNQYKVVTDQQNVFPDIIVSSSNNGYQALSQQAGGSILWLTTLSGSSVSVYPYITQGANQGGGSVQFQVSSKANVNTISFMFSDRSYDPNALSVNLEFSSNSTVLATGTYSVTSQGGVSTISELPIQLNKIVTLYPGISYQVVESSPQSGDNYAGSSGGGVTQDYLTETADPPSAGYLGQATWAPMQLGLMNLEPNGISNYNYLGSTDLQFSPGENGNNQVALRFQAPSTSTLQEFAVEVVRATYSSNVLNVTLRADNSTCPTGLTGSCSHPTNIGSSLAYGTVSFSNVNASFHACSGAYGGICSWANVTFVGNRALTGGSYYWMVMNTTGGQYMQLERLVSPYKDLVYVSNNDFQSKWGPPNDGPSDISFQIITSAGDINNTIQGDNPIILGTAAQSFESPSSFQLKGVWLATSIDSPGSISVSIETDSGTDSPSGKILANGTISRNTPSNSMNYASLDFPVNITANVKYWIVVSSNCFVSSCSSPFKVYSIIYRQDSISQDYGGSSLHYEINSGGVWTSPSQEGDMLFILAASTSTIHTYNTTSLYNEVVSYDSAATPFAPEGPWNTFLNYEQSEIMYNLTQVMQSISGRQFQWYTGMPSSIVDLVINVNPSDILFADSGAGGALSCPPSYASCGGSSTFWPSDASTHISNLLSSPYQNNWLPWSSLGFTQDNRGSLTPTELRTDYLVGVPLIARNPIEFDDFFDGFLYHGIYNMTQVQPAQAFGSVLNRMSYSGSYFGYEKNAVRALFLSNSNYGFFPQFLSGSINVTLATDNNLTGINLNQFNVIVGDPTTLTPNAFQRVTAFVKNGGGIVETAFASLPNTQDDFLGLGTSSTSASVTSTLSIVTPNKITAPYSSVTYTPYWERYLISSISNESAQILVKDSNNNPVISVNNYFSGRGVMIEQPYARLSYSGNPISFDGCCQYGSPRDSYISLLINSIFYAANDQNMLPVMWESAYSQQQNWSPYLQFSIDGTPGNPVLLWVSNNDSVSSPFDIHLNATFYGISSQGWVAINMQNMQVVAKGTGSDIHISTTIGPYDWAPIYIVSDPSSSNLQALYSTAKIVSTSQSGSSETYSLSGPLNSSNWLVLSSTSPLNSISSTLVGSISSYSSLSSLNQTQIGYYCASISNNACNSWTSRDQEGYYYDSTNNILYVHLRGDSAFSLTLSSSGALSGSTTSTTSSISGSSSPGTSSFSDPHVTSTTLNQNTQFSLKWSDTSGISGYIFSYDSGSGNFVNDSYVSLSNPTNVWTNTTKTISGTIGEKVQWMYYVKDASGLWTKSYTFSFVAGTTPSSVSPANFRLLTDDAYDLLAYDGTNLANLGNFPQFVGTYGSYVGFHEVTWNPQGTMAIAVGYNNSMVLYTKSSGSLSVIPTGLSSNTNLDGVAWTPNGTSAIITGSGPDAILAYSTTTGRLISLTNPTGVTNLGSVAWNPASNYALITGSNGLIKYSQGGSLSIVPSASGISFKGIDFNPNGTMALLSAAGGSFYKYTSATSSVSLVTTLSGITQLQQVKFSRDGVYALITAQSGSTSDLYKFDGATVYAVSSGSTNTANEISFSPNDSFASITTTGGGLLTENYDSNFASLTTISTNTRFRGIDFLPFAMTTTTTTTTTTSTTSSISSLGTVSIQASTGPYGIGSPITISGDTYLNGSPASYQTIYVWINGQNMGSVTSSSSGYWTYSFTPTTAGTYYASVSQDPDGSGVTSQQLALSVQQMSNTTSITGGSTTYSTTSSSQTITSAPQPVTTTESTQTTSVSKSVSTDTSTKSSSTSSFSTPSLSSTNTKSSSSFSSSASGQASATRNSSTNNTTQAIVSNSSSTTSHQTSLAAFSFFPFSSSPGLVGTSTFALLLGLVTAAPFVVKKLVNRAKNQDKEESHDWRW